jgi:hypothetical protein
MAIMKDYSPYYAILRVTHDTDWKALRACYKRLVGQWHPDRFPADGSERALAEERTKEITLAYQVIERYYRDHGVLPPMESATDAKNTGTATRQADEASGGSSQTSANAAQVSPRAPEKSVPGRRFGMLIVLSVLVVGMFAAYHQSDDDMQQPNEATADTRVSEIAPTEPTPQETPRETGGISPGSTLGEVYAIQGIPTLTEGETWHYGKSSIRFAQGKVVSWTQHPDNPLRIARDQPIELREGVFDIGSTKDEVRSIQGTPVTETETVWDYGPSRVYFEHNRVVRWEASPLQPLHVAR